jgi:HD-GYP domain-containing protein (c-di-GMP phosphodiesterase class II)
MTTDRAYRQKMSHAEAITEMERVKGQQLDARAVDAFVLLPGPEAGA